jgi:hypothetical protein
MKLIMLTTTIWFLVLSGCAAQGMAEQEAAYDADVAQCRTTFPAQIGHYSDRAQFDCAARDPVGLGQPVGHRELLPNGSFLNRVTTRNFAYLRYDLKPGRGFAGFKSLPPVASPVTGGGGSSLGPVTAFHYANNGNFSGSTFLPGSVGFNLADVLSPSQLAGLPLGVKGLMWSGNPNGVDGAFITLITGCLAHIDKLFAIYLADTANPDPGATWGTYFDPANLRAQVDYIHLHLPGVKTYIWLANLGSDEYHVDYTSYLGHAGYTPSNTGIDYYGISGYPVASDLTGSYDLSVIDNHVAGALAAGIPLGALVPTYQTFGGGSWGRPYVVPNAAQLTALLARWASLVPTPPFDYAYSWGTQRGDTALESLPLLQAVMLAHNS